MRPTKNMFLLGLLCIKILLASADQAKHNGHCDSTQDFCKGENNGGVLNFENKRYLFYDVNPPEGFNLRRDVYMRFAIMLSEAQKRAEKENWVLVLPPWYNIYHWRSKAYRDPPKPWNVFFDVQALGSYAPVLEMHKLMEVSGRYGLQIDTLYILQNYEDPFENGVFKDKWDVVGACEYDGLFWGYHNIKAKQIICVQFQGSISKLWEVIELNPDDERVMFAHGEIPLHDTYGTKPYWDCRKSMQFSQNLVVAAEIYINKKLHCYKTKCSNYLALHWRRQDFVRSNRSTSINSTAKQMDDTIKNNNLDIHNIFIASDGNAHEIDHLQETLKSFGYTAHFYIPDIDTYVDGEIAVIEQIICSRSAFFIGTHESTFSFRIQEEREILGFPSDTTFNRLCPDVGKCEKPSQWTIVH